MRRVHTRFWRYWCSDVCSSDLLTEDVGPGGHVGGSYAFADVAPGTYVLREVGKTGWTCDYPGTGGSCQHAVTLDTTNINSSGNDFGNHPASTVVTTQEPASGQVGSKFGDSAKVSGPSGAPTPTGTVEFRLY